MSKKDNSEEVKFISLDEAASMKSGTRVTFIPGMQALYAEALKNICYVKKVPLIRALHPLMGVNKETGEDSRVMGSNNLKRFHPPMLHGPGY